jgi:hypothetical protein
MGSILMHFRHTLPYKSITYENIMLTNSVSGLSLGLNPLERNAVDFQYQDYDPSISKGKQAGVGTK